LVTLKIDGSGKAEVEHPKKIIGSPEDLPVAVSPVNDLLGLGVTEGLEDRLSVYQATGLGVWAAGGAGFMPKLAAMVPAYVEAVTIYAHSDQARQAGANALAHNLFPSGALCLAHGSPRWPIAATRTTSSSRRAKRASSTSTTGLGNFGPSPSSRTWANRRAFGLSRSTTC
jgi:hypothetical protein